MPWIERFYSKERRESLRLIREHSADVRARHAQLYPAALELLGDDELISRGMIGFHPTPRAREVGGDYWLTTTRLVWLLADEHAIAKCRAEGTIDGPVGEITPVDSVRHIDVEDATFRGALHYTLSVVDYRLIRVNLVPLGDGKRFGAEMEQWMLALHDSLRHIWNARPDPSL